MSLASQTPMQLSLDPALAPARAAFDQGHWAEAEQQARAFLGTHPNSAEAQYLLATTLFRENKPKDSLAAFTQAAQLARPSALDFRSIAFDYVLLNDYTDADTWMTRSAQDNPKDGETWYAIGRIKYTENRFAESITSFKKALQLMPQSVKAEDNLGLAYEGLNQPDEAIAAYQQALAWQAGSPHPSEQPMLNLGILLTDRNQFDTALPLLKQAETLAPTDGKVHGALGKLYARLNDLPEAQTELEQALATDPKNSGLHFQLGQVYRKQGKTQQAAGELERAAALEREARH
ncbi:MAG: tetratricopeptide repeat protein [Janthinobacterium lividum]